MNLSGRKKLSQVIVFKRSLIKKLTKGLIVITFLTTTLTYFHYRYPHLKLDISAQLPGYMGAALGLLLVFRNNTAYDKWWEARKEMGALVNTTRNIAITINGIIPPDCNEKYSLAKLTKTFAASLTGHFRDGVDMEELKDLRLGPDDYMQIKKASHKPNIIANLMIMKVENLYLQKKITDIQQELVVRQINYLVDIMGKCERIRNTPIPMAYSFLLKFFINLYVVVLPLGLWNELGWWAIPLVIILYYILMSIVITAEEIEEPFGKDVNDLPMETIANTIKNNIDEIVKLH